MYRACDVICDVIKKNVIKKKPFLSRLIHSSLRRISLSHLLQVLAFICPEGTLQLSGKLKFHRLTKKPSYCY